MFKINDRVRLKNDNKENPALTVRSEVGGQRFLCISDCGQRMVWACDRELELVERNTDLKQAIREVLLSEQFLREFAKAFVNTPRPSTIQAWSPITGSESEAYCLQKMERERQAEQPKATGHFDDVEGVWIEEKSPFDGRRNSDKIPEGYRKLKDSSIEPRQLGDLRWSVGEKRYVEIAVEEIGYANRDNWPACRKVEPAIKQSLTTEPPDGWRFLEVGEVIRKGDQGFENGLFYAIDSLIGIELQAHWIPMIRRNRFEVGEKVVHGFGDRQSISVVENILGDGWVDLGRDGVSTAYHVNDLAPYIEETK